MKTELKTPLKIHGGSAERLFDAEGKYLAVVSTTRLPEMLEVVRRANAFDALVEALEKVQRDISDGATLVDAAATYCNRHNTSEALVGVLELRRVVETALALAKEGK